ncbi:site-specific integrase [Pseudomonas putida]|uniref:site-specific integrase n=1 Tax=Pseudomonas putida TaxID=303 RepID=UPI0002D82F7E|nr:site-specific integrase [Pseudomonas putida]
MLADENQILPMLQLAQFKKLATPLIFGDANAANDIQPPMEALSFFNFLRVLKVSKTSFFLDLVWDWNADSVNVAKTMKGSKLSINFERHTWIPAEVLLELKVIIYCYSLAPGILTQLDKRSKAKKPSKKQTIVGVFDQGLLFIDKLYEVLSRKLGAEYVRSEMCSLKDVPAQYFETAACEHSYAYSSKLRVFFSIITAQFFQNTVFDGAVANIQPDQLKWKKKSSEVISQKERDAKGTKKKIISNECFQRASSLGAYAIVDFLDAMGHSVADQASLERRNQQGYFASQANGLTPEAFAVYAYKRLDTAGYPKDFIRETLGADTPYVDEILSTCTTTALKRYAEKSGSNSPASALWPYLNSVSNACMYMIGQYTAMRVSELADLKADTCLKPDGARWLIQSNVHKHDEESVLLFDDCWVAIPIVQDAVRAIALINKIKNNPYVFSNVFTVPFGKQGEALSSSSYKDPILSFIKSAMPPGKAEGIHFYPNMLRHTLAYQLYRADVGLPFISHQLKHFSGIVGNFGLRKGFSQTTLAYGEIGDMLAGTSHNDASGELRHAAELELVKNLYDPTKGFAGQHAKEHVAHLERRFEGYMAAGYTQDEVFEAITRQRIAVISTGQAFCYGNRAEDFDSSIPCIGGLRCNPQRCDNAVITEGNAPAWRTVYEQNSKILRNQEVKHLHEAAKAAMEEARGVLLKLGQAVDDE